MISNPTLSVLISRMFSNYADSIADPILVIRSRILAFRPFVRELIFSVDNRASPYVAQMSRVTGAFKYPPIKFLALPSVPLRSRGLRLNLLSLLSHSRKGNPDPQFRPTMFQPFEGMPHCVEETKHSLSPLFSTRLMTPSRWIWISLRERGEGSRATTATTDSPPARFLKRSRSSEKVTAFCPPHFFHASSGKKSDIALRFWDWQELKEAFYKEKSREPL